MTLPSPAILRHEDLHDLARSLHADGPVVLLSDRGVEAGGVLDAFRDRFPHDGPIVVMEPGEPTVERVDAVSGRVRRLRPTSIVALGGGSVIDTAKLVATGLGTTETVRRRVGPGASLTKEARVVAVPTTAGSGSEMTRTAVVSDGDGTKRWAWGDALRPDDAVLVPELSLGAPPGLTTSAGVDAFVHAVEAASASGRAHSPPAVEALALIADALPRVCDAPSDVVARRDMQWGAALAGTAIDANGTGVAHAIGHALATVHTMPHGFAVGLGLHATIDWSIAGANIRYRSVAIALGAADVDEIPKRIAALLAAARFRDLAAVHLPAELNEAALARAIASDDNLPMRTNNARPASTEDAEHLARLTAALWRSWRTS